MALNNLTPINRMEKFLNKIAGATVSITPITRKEFFLNKIAGNMPPAVSGSDNGKVMTVVNGKWAKAAASGGLPSMSIDTNNKVLTCEYDGVGSYIAVWDTTGKTGYITENDNDIVMYDLDFFTMDALLGSGHVVRFKEELADGTEVYSSTFTYESQTSLKVIFQYYSGTSIYLDIYDYDPNDGTFTKTQRTISTSARS